MRRRKKRGKIISKGVKRIIEFLKLNEFDFKTEYRIKECRDKLPLPFDFVIFKNNNILLIEFQGIQHYKKIRKFGGQKALTKQKIHDIIKVDYCLTHKIPLLIISYEDENIEELCYNFLK